MEERRKDIHSFLSFVLNGVFETESGHTFQVSADYVVIGLAAKSKGSI